MKNTVLLLLSTISIAAAQSPLLLNYIQDARKGHYPSAKALIENKSQYENVLKEIPPFLSDTLKSVRQASYSLLRQIGSASDKTGIRTKTVSLLSSSLTRFSDDGDVISSALQNFTKEDFDTPSRAAIQEALSTISNKNSLILLAGYVGDAGTIPYLKPFSLAGNQQTIRWSALAAMTRLGDGEAMNEILRRVKKIPLTGDVILHLFPDLVYTRQKQIYDYLVEVLNSDKEDCESADNDHPKPILCGYRIMEMLAPAIKNFPLEVDAGGDMAAKDYPKALEKVRKWFEKHKDFEIKKEGF